MRRLLVSILAFLIILPSIPVRAAENPEVLECKSTKEIAHQMAECARKLGYPEDCTIIKEAQAKWKEADTEEKELLKPKYTAEDLDLLSRIVYAEAGCYWIPDWVQRDVASVVINRVNSDKYPDTIRDVINQPGQYGRPSAAQPDSRTVGNVRYVLENGSTIPYNVLGQNGDATGNGIYTSYYDPVLGTTIYFTYG